MPPQGLNLNEYGIESGVTAPQARKFAFLGHKSAKISFLLIRFLGGRVAEWLARSHRLPRAVVFAGSWVRVPSLLGRAVLPTAGGICVCCYSVDAELYISMDE